MPRDYTSKAPIEVRRKDRAVTDEVWIKDFLKKAPFGVVASSIDGQPFAHSNIFVYDESKNVIYLHTAKEGRTRSNIIQNTNVCLSISEMGRLLPADEALEFSVEYKGVAIFGDMIIVEEEDESTYALQMLLDKYFPHLSPGKDYRPPVPEELKRTSVFRINISSWIGKQKKEKADFPGAFWYEEGREGSLQ